MTRYAIAVLLAALPLAAQTTSVQGLVTDSQGAAIPEAIVTAKNLDTSAERKTLTNALGEYAMLQMPPGYLRGHIRKTGLPRLQIRSRAAGRDAVHSQHEVGSRPG